MAHQYRLARFRFEDLARGAHVAVCELIVADLPTIMNTFSGRLEGLHRHKKAMKIDGLIGTWS